MGRTGFKTFQSVLDCLKIRFGDGGRTVYTKKDMANMVIIMAKNNVSAHSAHKNGPPDAKIPSGDWFLKKIRPIKPDRMRRTCDKMITESAMIGELCGRHGGSGFGAPVIAIDKHKIAHYDRDPDMKFMVHSKKEAGTYTFESHMTARIVSGARELTLHSELVTRSDFNPKFVRNSIKKCTKYRLGAYLYLLDREFYATDVMRTIRELRRHYIIPAVKNKGIKQAISEHAQGKRDAVSRYTVSNGTESHRFNLIIIPSKCPEAERIFDRYHAFATSLPCKDPKDAVRRIPEQYRKRWGIETGYKSSKGIKPYTTSKNPAIRMLMFTISVILANIWVCLRQAVAKQTYNATLIACLNMMINSFYVSSHSKWPPPTE